MSLTATELAEEALALPSQARVYLAEKLLESLDFEEDFVVSEGWRKEIRQRCRELDQGNTKTIPAETAIQELRRSLA